MKEQSTKKSKKTKIITRDNNHLVDKLYKKRYLSARAKFFIALIGAILWVGLSLVISHRWYLDLSALAGPFGAALIVIGVAYIPGFMNAFLLISLLLDRQPQLINIEDVHDKISVLIAAYNEEDSIYEALSYLKKQRYAGPLKIIVVNNNSTDNTAAEVARAREELGLDILLVNEPEQGKFHALNKGLKYIKTKFFISLDADTLVHPDAIVYLVARMKASSHEVCAVAGSVLAENSRDNLLTRFQEWDYFLSIASIKRMQGMYQGTLVAQGAFSLYQTKTVRAIGGWSDAIGEDIVFTWKMLRGNAKVYFEPFAVAFTTVPVTMRAFVKQRARWARGMIEGLREVKPWQQPALYQKFSTGIDLLIPLIDFCYTVFWIPGLIAAVFFQNYAIVGPMALLVLPLTLACFSILYFFQLNVVFKRLNLKVRKNFVGFLVFMVAYQAIMSTVSLYGYAQELFHTKRIWK